MAFAQTMDEETEDLANRSRAALSARRRDGATGSEAPPRTGG